MSKEKNEGYKSTATSSHNRGYQPNLTRPIIKVTGGYQPEKGSSNNPGNKPAPKAPKDD